MRHKQEKNGSVNYYFDYSNADRCPSIGIFLEFDGLDQIGLELVQLSGTENSKPMKQSLSDRPKLGRTIDHHTTNSHSSS